MLDTPPLRILIVDDDVTLSAILAAYARSRGHVPIEVQDGPAALLQAATAAPDVVLLDVAMPKLDGRDVCAELRRCAATARIPVLAMSGRGEDPHLRAQLLELGASDVLAKPLRLEDTFARIERLAAERRAAAPRCRT